MGWESFDVVRFDLDVRLKSSDVRFDLGPLLQSQTMVHCLGGVVFPVDTNWHQFSDAYV